MDTLPVELLHKIFLSDVLVWKNSVLAIPFLHKYIDSKYAERKFTVVRENENAREYFVVVDNKLVRHRKKGPAIIWKKGGGEEWYLRGVLHRDSGPALFFPNKANKANKEHKEWWRKGKLHREDGPAVSRENYEAWYIDGKRSRDGDLPAVIWKKGKGGKEIRLYCYKGGLSVK